MLYVEELYKDFHMNCDDCDDYFNAPYDYSVMTNTFGDVVIEESDDDYQGDTFILYRNEEKYGYLSFGWGSCCGCDALQACCNWGEVQELYDELKSNIQWFNSANEARSWFNNHDWDGDWMTTAKCTFVEKVKEYFNK